MYETFRGTHVGKDTLPDEERGKHPKHPCARCGRVREYQPRPGRRNLCRDCSSGMTPEERAKW